MLASKFRPILTPPARTAPPAEDPARGRIARVVVPPVAAGAAVAVVAVVPAEREEPGRPVLGAWRVWERGG